MPSRKRPAPYSIRLATSDQVSLRRAAELVTKRSRTGDPRAQATGPRSLAAALVREGVLKILQGAA